MNRKIFCIAAALLTILTGCSDLKSRSEEQDSSLSSAENSVSESDADNSDESKSEAENDGKSLFNIKKFSTVPYAMDKDKCAVEVPSEFNADSEISAVSGRLHLNGEEPDDMIALDVFNGMSAEEFGSFDENDLFELINYSTTLPQLQYFKEVEIKNADGVENKAYMGETLGTIDGVDTYVTMLAVNCPEYEKMYVFSMRDKNGEFQDYRDNMNEYLYITDNGYAVENGKLVSAPEPEPITHTNSEIGYTINLPEGWGLITDTTGLYGLESYTYHYDKYDIFMSNDNELAVIASKSMDVSDQMFYSSFKEQFERIDGVGGDNIVSTSECEIGGYAAYQVVVNHTAGAYKTTSTSWLINVTGNDPHILAIQYQYDDSGEFADKLINSITLE
ncbi:MAG: hypothetical protein NC320_06440 [Clostridium sp.]|nr:hypothetical protein [Clostridium sp.]